MLIRKNFSALTNVTQVYRFLLLASVFSLPWVGPNLNNYILYLAVIAGFIHYYLLMKSPKPVFSRLYIPLLSLFFIQIIGLVNSSDLRYGLRNIETMAPFVTFIFLATITSDQLTGHFVNQICWSFLAGVIFTILCSTIMVIAGTFGEQHSPFEYGHSSISPLLHPSYFSLYIALSIFFLLEKTIIEKAFNWWIGILLFILIVFLILLNSRAAIGAFLVTSFLLLILQLRLKGKIIFCVGIVCFLALLLSFPATKNRFFDGPMRALSIRGDVDANDQTSWPISFRIQIYSCAYDVIKDSFLFGYGTGDANASLQKCYEKNEFNWLITRKFNAHSEYLQETIRHGVVGLVILVTVFFAPLIYSVRSKSFLHTAFLLMVIVCAVPESLFSLHKGTFFFGLFYVVLIKRKEV